MDKLIEVLQEEKEKGATLDSVLIVLKKDYRAYRVSADQFGEIWVDEI